ncbi:MAG: fluoride efflux transporter CrcB [Rhodocyclaceae bacterium]|nr:fluoride efflux transporter CrcB [Rhodocyclaceae bacterium]MBX3671078.1 fluoride efflux transporter CrcB [Rhodocyclaceae bacterium]
MNAAPMLAVFCGAGLGALLRWWLGMLLNSVFPTLPLGTLAANLIGGLLIGLAVGFFSHNGGLAPEWRLFAVTGFLGGLTTFSTFSAEVVSLLAHGQYHWAVLAAGVHLFGSLTCTAAGWGVANWLFIPK